MGNISDSANYAFRDFVVDGVPSSGRNPPSKSDIRSTFNLTDGEFTALSNISSVNLNTSTAHSVRLATTTALPAYVYDNGAAGVGATISMNSTGVLTIDGKVVKNTQRILVKDEVNTVYNGIYRCTQAGAVSVQAILTRANDADSPAELDSMDVVVTGGSQTGINIGTTWNQPLTASSITIGTTGLVFSKTDAPAVAPVTSVGGLTGDITTAQVQQGVFLGQVIIESTIASATTTDLTGATSPKILISGTTPITAFTVKNHSLYFLRFAAALTLTYNATTMLLPGQANIVTQPGDCALMSTDSTGNCRVRHYQRAALSVDVASKRNWLINGHFQVWQENVTYAPNSNTPTFTSDRWKVYRTTVVSTFSRQAGFSGATYCLRSQRNNGDTHTANLVHSQQIPSDLCAGLAGQIVVFSFDARAGAGYSGGTLGVRIHSGTGTDELFDLSVPGFTTGETSSSLLTGVTPTTTAQKIVTAPYTIPSNATEIAVEIRWLPSGTAGTTDYVEFTNCKLEIGQINTPYEYPPTMDVLAHCQRHYQKSFLQGTVPATNIGTSTGEAIFTCSKAAATINLANSVRFANVMRAVPSVTIYNPSAANNQIRNVTQSTDGTSTSASANSDNSFNPGCTGVSGWAVGDQLAFHWVADARL